MTCSRCGKKLSAGDERVLANETGVVLRPARLESVRPGLPAEAGGVIVCSWCKTELDPKTAIVLPGWGHGCPQKDWNACSDRAEQNYQDSLKEKAA